jgi:hypothetical protein
MSPILLQPDGVQVTAQQERQGRAAQHGGGVGRPLGGRSGFRVDTHADVLTATSTKWTLRPCSAEIDPGASTHQGMYGWASEVNIAGDITPSDSTYDRKDIVYIQVNDSSAGDGTAGAPTAPVLYLAGAASATPVAPALPPRSFLVGTINVPKTGGGSPTVILNPARYVAAGAPLPATLAERDALDEYPTLSVVRTDLGGVQETWDGAAWTRGIQHVEFTGEADNTVTAGTLWGLGFLTKDSTRSRNDAGLVSPGRDTVTLPGPATYLIWARCRLDGTASGQTYISFTDAAGAEIDSKDIIAGTPGGTYQHSNFYVPATADYKIRFKTDAAGRKLSGRIAITRIQ